MPTKPEGGTWTEADYLAFEAETEFKHEFVDGQVWALVGGNRYPVPYRKVNLRSHPMSALPKDDAWTEAEYLAFEAEAESKHEFVDGQVVAMVGASRKHSLITGNTQTSLNIQLADRPCEIYASDMRVHIDKLKSYVYPDLSVVCGEVQLLGGIFDTLVNPNLVIEVLSPSTEARDRGRKFQLYRSIPSLQIYLLVLQTDAHIERYTRMGGGTWSLTDFDGLDAQVELPAIGCELALSDVYRKVTFKLAANATDAD